MSKPEPIPSDVLEKAQEWVEAMASWDALGLGTGHRASIIARAIMDAASKEREAIAEMVDVFADTADFSAMNVVHDMEVVRFRHEERALKSIAEIIRKRGE